MGRQAELVEDLLQLMAVGGQPLVELVPDPLVATTGQIECDTAERMATTNQIR